MVLVILALFRMSMTVIAPPEPPRLDELEALSSRKRADARAAGDSPTSSRLSSQWRSAALSGPDSPSEEATRRPPVEPGPGSASSLPAARSRISSSRHGTCRSRPASTLPRDKSVRRGRRRRSGSTATAASGGSSRASTGGSSRIASTQERGAHCHRNPTRSFNRSGSHSGISGRSRTSTGASPGRRRSVAARSSGWERPSTAFHWHRAMANESAWMRAHTTRWSTGHSSTAPSFPNPGYGHRCRTYRAAASRSPFQWVRQRIRGRRCVTSSSPFQHRRRLAPARAVHSVVRRSGSAGASTANAFTRSRSARR